MSAPAAANNNIENEHILRTKQVFERLFPNVPSSNVDYGAWLANLSTHIEEQQKQNCRPQGKTVNKLQNGDDEAESITGNGHHTQGNGQLSTSEELILQNAHLKSIVAETSEILTSLEEKACLQDEYWRGVVELKDNEIRSLQQNSVPST